MAREIPEKVYFKIGEVAELIGVKPHVLRYWESEFSCLKPTKSRSKQRLFRREDIDIARQIKDLLYDQGFTISGARTLLKKQSSKAKPQPTLIQGGSDTRQLLRVLHGDISALRDSITPSKPSGAVRSLNKPKT